MGRFIGDGIMYFLGSCCALHHVRGGESLSGKSVCETFYGL